jgi:hypothetical protein
MASAVVSKAGTFAADSFDLCSLTVFQRIFFRSS